MIPLQTILLTLLILSAAPLPEDRPATSAIPLFLTLGLLAGLVGAIFGESRRSLAKLDQTASNADSVLYQFDRAMGRARWITLALLSLVLFDFAIFSAYNQAAVKLHLPHAPDTLGIREQFLINWQFQRVPGLAELALLVPLLLTWICFWVFQYDLETAARLRGLPERLAHNLPVHELPSRRQFVTMQVRHNFYILIILVAKVLLDRGIAALPLAKQNDYVVPIATLVVVLIFLILSPWFMVSLWTTTPLTGPLRVRLDAMAAKYHLKFRDVLIWKTHHMVTNAAIAGAVPKFRYFLLSDSLLEALTDEQIEAVFAHEVGHGRHHHLWWYLGAFVGALALAAAVTDLLTYYLAQHQHPEFAAYSDQLALIPLLFFFAFVFSRLSRRFEHQADWFAAQHLAGDSGSEPDLPRGATLFSNALLGIVHLAHRPEQKDSWLHPAPTKRVKLLTNLATSADARARFQSQMTSTRLLVMALVIVGVALLALDSRVVPQTSTSDTPTELNHR